MQRIKAFMNPTPVRKEVNKHAPHRIFEIPKPKPKASNKPKSIKMNPSSNKKK